MKRYILFVINLLCFLQFSVCDAEAKYDEEIFMPVGSYFKLNTNDEVNYFVLGDKAKVVFSYYGKAVYLEKTGQEIVRADFYINGDYNYPSQLTYLINIVPLKVYQQGEKNGFDKLNYADMYSEINENFAEEVLKLVNMERAKVNLKPLRLADDLKRGASIRAKELTVRFDHKRPDGRNCFTVVSKQGRGVGENIAAGPGSAEEVVKGWMNSPGHRRNILDPLYKELGVGFFLLEDDPNMYRYYWVQLFRR